MDLNHTYLYVDPRAPSGYFEGYCDDIGVIEKTPPQRVVGSKPARLLRTKNTGEKGRSDARYVEDRLGSGLYFAVRVETV